MYDCFKNGIGYTHRYNRYAMMKTIAIVQLGNCTNPKISVYPYMSILLQQDILI